MNKSGEAIIDTNVMIVIGLVSLVLILTGFFFFGEDIQNFISNFLPEYEKDSGVDEVVASDGDESVSYVLEVGEFNGIREKTYEESSGFSLGMNDFYNSILKDFVVLSINRSNKEIVKLNSYSDNNIDPDPKTNPVRISFKEGKNVEVDFVYDAKEKLVKFGNVNTGVLINCDESDLSRLISLDSSIFFEKEITSYFSSIGIFSDDSKNLNKEDVGDFLTICSSKGLDNFVTNIISIVDKRKEMKWSFGLLGDNQYLVVGANSYSTIPGDTLTKKKNYIYSLITKNRPKYISSWKLGGNFLDTEGNSIKDLSYSCFFNGEFSDCSKQFTGEAICPSGCYDFCLGKEIVLAFSSSIFLNSDKSASNGVRLASCEKKMNIFPYSSSDKVFYIKGSEIWVAEYGANVKNYCWRSLVSSSRCS